MEILEFVKASEVDPVYFDMSYHVAPDSNITKPYVLLLKAMAETGYYGVAKVAMHNREHIVILRPAGKELMLHTMFYANEIQAGQNVLDNAEELKGKELDLAKQLIETLAAKFNPEQFHDEYQANVQKLIEQKQKGQAVVSAPQPKLAPVIDIFDALQRSLEQSGKKAPETVERKPPARATAKKKTVSRKRGAA
jgi:DNA end-binding protein Ku